jgi:hypothetical protein
MEGFDESVPIRTRSFNGIMVWAVRDIGRACGYGSNGGNFSRNIRMKKWDAVLDYGTDIYRESESSRAMWWITRLGMLRLIPILVRDEPARYPALQQLLSIHLNSTGMVRDLVTWLHELEAQLVQLTREVHDAQSKDS